MNQSSLNITFAQLNATVGDIAGNSTKMLSCLEKHKGQTDLVVFPELFLTGYSPDDLLLRDAFLNDIENAVNQLLEHSKNLPAFILPTPHRENNKLYNVAHICEDGEIIHTHYKVELPNYGVFDEKRYFESGRTPTCFEINGTRIGLMICEDIWFTPTATKLKDGGAELLLSISASPFTETKTVQREAMLQNRFTETNLPHFALNLLGGQDEIVFDGGVIGVDKDGSHHTFTNVFEEISVTFDVLNLEKPNAPILLSREKKLYKAVTLGLRDYVHKNGFEKVLIGLSGGIDSALVAALAADALGTENVRTFFMPSDFSSKTSLKDAEECAKLLNISFESRSIAPSMEALENLLPECADTAHENMQSRLRGLVLMALSNQTGALVLSTGNKSEMAVGYATLYGDMCGAYNPLKDLYKTDVKALCNWRNEKSRVIPENIVTKAPTAELRKDQKDEDSLPPYERLDKLLKLYIEGQKSIADAVNQGFDRDEATRIWKLLKRAEYKRFQAPPGPKLTEIAFGRNRRLPLTDKSKA